MVSRPERKELVLKDADILFLNFKGAEGRYNKKGEKNFCVKLSDTEAEAMVEDGWNIKYLKPRDEGDEPQAYMHVSVNYDKGRPPRVVMITSRGRTELGEDETELLDWADIEHVDLIINPYHWVLDNGDHGVKAYLKSIYVTIREDELELKYSDLNQIPSNSGKVED